MPYKSIISNKEFQEKLVDYQKEYKKLVNSNFNIIDFNYSSESPNEKAKRTSSLYDFLFEGKYDNVLDFFSTK